MDSSPETKALVDALDAKATAVDRQFEEVQQECIALQRQLDIKHRRLQGLRSELDAIQELRSKYIPPPTILTQDRASSDVPPISVRDAILSLIKGSNAQAVHYEEAIRVVSEMRDAGKISTEATSDNRKLVASTIGNLLRAGTLVRHGDVLMYPT